MGRLRIKIISLVQILELVDENLEFTKLPPEALPREPSSAEEIEETLEQLLEVSRRTAQNQTRFFICSAVAIIAALGIAFARNLFTLFLFYELLTFSTYPLVTHAGTEKAKRAGRVYLGVLVFTSVAFLLCAILLTAHYTGGDLEFRAGGILDGKIEGTPVYILLGLFAFGTGKAALMPFHRWLPSAMVAPTPVSALLHAVAVVKAGVFTILKVVVYIFGIDFLQAGHYSTWLCWVAAFTLIASSMIALTKDNLKARLAYSTISQLSYIVLGAALATSLSVLGGGMHIAMHAMGKITLFFCAGSIIVFAHKTKVSTMDGLGRRMPWTMAAFFLGSLSIIGLPPMGGSWSKWFLALGAADSGQWIFIAVLMLSSLLSIGYLMPIVGRAFFRPPQAWTDEDGVEHAAQTEYREGAPLCTIPLCLTALGCVALFVYGGALRDLLLPILELKRPITSTPPSPRRPCAASSSPSSPSARSASPSTSPTPSTATTPSRTSPASTPPTASSPASSW